MSNDFIIQDRTYCKVCNSIYSTIMYAVYMYMTDHHQYCVLLVQWEIPLIALYPLI